MPTSLHPEIIQLVRESPPGFGGIERVAHELASSWSQEGKSSLVYYFLTSSKPAPAVTNNYSCIGLPAFLYKRIYLLLPSFSLYRLLFSSSPLHVHLPCPVILLVLFFARIIRPSRYICVHWHSFLESPDPFLSFLFWVYQNLALASLKYVQSVITTSPVLRDLLIQSGIAPHRISVLPCPISQRFELANPTLIAPDPSIFNLISIGRLDSYKRVDWLIQVYRQSVSYLACEGVELRLHIVGSGPKLAQLQLLSHQCEPANIFFYGRVDDDHKLRLLQQSDLLVLPFNSCHEAFGIVQLEAMCLGVPALTFYHQRSGCSWVSSLPSLPSVNNCEELSSTIRHLATDPVLMLTVRSEARRRYLEYFSRNNWDVMRRDVF